MHSGLLQPGATAFGGFAMIPGEYLLDGPDIELNAGRSTKLSIYG